MKLTHEGVLKELEDLIRSSSPDEIEAFLDAIGAPRRHGSVRYSLAAIKGVGEGAARHIVEVRETGGDFRSVEDFFRRVDTKIVNKRCAEALVKAGAFDALNPNRCETFESLARMFDLAASERERREKGFGSMGTLR